MEITKEWLEAEKACDEARHLFKHQKETDAVTILLLLAGNELQEKYGISYKTRLRWANWLVTRVLEGPVLVEYAVFAPEQVLYIYEKKYPKGKGPREAIAAAKVYIQNPSQETADAAAEAADEAAEAAGYAAAEAAYSAGCAGYAAYGAADAAAEAAYSAGYADYAAYGAADAAGYAAFSAGYAVYSSGYAAYLAGYSDMLKRIVQHGIALFKKQEAEVK